MAEIWLFNGPNMNLLGQREAIYGSLTLEQLVLSLKTEAARLGHNLTDWQGHDEAAAISQMHAAMGKVDALIINPAAWTHTSVALRDAIAALNVPFVEVHITNIMAREPFRHTSLFSDLAVGVIQGLGTDGYQYALNFLHQQIIKR